MMNANNPQTPGVYTVEKNAFPPSVAQVPTAIPAFVGYTETASRQGKSLLNTPILISSLHEYVQYFGGAPEYKFPIHPVTNTDPTKPPKPEDYDFTIGPHYYKIGAAQEGLFYLYNSLRLFYLNGGGSAYIVSTGTYMEPTFSTDAAGKVTKEMGPATVDRDKLMDGLDLLTTIQFPKPTMILIPDLMALEKAEDCYVVQQQMIAQAGGQKDRVAMLDVYKGWQGTDSGVISSFRNNMGVSDLDYAISYYPWLECAVVDAAEVSYANLYTPTAGSTDPVDIQSILKGLPLLKKLSQISGDMDNLKEGVFTPALKLGKTPPSDATTYDSWTQAFNSSPDTDSQDIIVDQGKVLYSMYQVIFELGNSASVSDDLPAPVTITKGSALQAAIQLFTNPSGPSAALMLELYNYESNFPSVSSQVFTKDSLGKVGILITTTGDNPTPNPNPYPSGTLPDAAYEIAEPVYKKALSQFMALINGMVSDAETLLMQYNTSLENSNKDYSHIMSSVAKQANILPPTAAMAGIYTLVDNTEGVWYAPANRNIDAVVAPMVSINDDQQAPLNVDALAGKSINVIRSFYGRGPAMVWGARTMAGNSLDYKYINVRRLMIMVEQSVANAAFSLVFKPNDASTWSICEAMISNFLANIWSEGALQGAKASDAFSVMVGLGKTMTPLDVLNGIMRVQVKVAVVRPAEFIIITYEQEMPKA